MGGDFGFGRLAAKNAKGTKVRDAHRRAKKNITPQQSIDSKPEQRGELLKDCERRR